ncbi:uncharacterized protein LOC126455705 [Schistocerca serialis cubense]|uniref:uncharacterized protein LOC126455705 n=1 Tax=Schistocerca serialis cubense TaxID=2023355 RepID=UPI00214E25CD|nr:uncharacterized protein LOC126455705 [Schistocerca serialis cubense]
MWLPLLLYVLPLTASLPAWMDHLQVPPADDILSKDGDDYGDNLSEGDAYWVERLPPVGSRLAQYTPIELTRSLPWQDTAARRRLYQLVQRLQTAARRHLGWRVQPWGAHDAQPLPEDPPPQHTWYPHQESGPYVFKDTAPDEDPSDKEPGIHSTSPNPIHPYHVITQMAAHSQDDHASTIDLPLEEFSPKPLKPPFTLSKNPVYPYYSISQVFAQNPTGVELTNQHGIPVNNAGIAGNFIPPSPVDSSNQNHPAVTATMNHDVKPAQQIPSHLQTNVSLIHHTSTDAAPVTVSWMETSSENSTAPYYTVPNTSAHPDLNSTSQTHTTQQHTTTHSVINNTEPITHSSTEVTTVVSGLVPVLTEETTTEAVDTDVVATVQITTPFEISTEQTSKDNVDEIDNYSTVTVADSASRLTTVLYHVTDHIDPSFSQNEDNAHGTSVEVLTEEDSLVTEGVSHGAQVQEETTTETYAGANGESWQEFSSTSYPETGESTERVHSSDIVAAENDATPYFPDIQASASEENVDNINKQTIVAAQTNKAQNGEYGVTGVTEDVIHADGSTHYHGNPNGVFGGYEITNNPVGIQTTFIGTYETTDRTYIVGDTIRNSSVTLPSNTQVYHSENNSPLKHPGDGSITDYGDAYEHVDSPHVTTYDDEIMEATSGLSANSGQKLETEHQVEFDEDDSHDPYHSSQHETHVPHLGSQEHVYDYSSEDEWVYSHDNGFYEHEESNPQHSSYDIEASDPHNGSPEHEAYDPHHGSYEQDVYDSYHSSHEHEAYDPHHGTEEHEDYEHQNSSQDDTNIDVDEDPKEIIPPPFFTTDKTLNYESSSLHPESDKIPLEETTIISEIHFPGGSSPWEKDGIVKIELQEPQSLSHMSQEDSSEAEFTTLASTDYSHTDVTNILQEEAAFSYVENEGNDRPPAGNLNTGDHSEMTILPTLQSEPSSEIIVPQDTDVQNGFTGNETTSFIEEFHFPTTTNKQDEITDGYLKPELSANDPDITQTTTVDLPETSSQQHMITVEKLTAVDDYTELSEVNYVSPVATSNESGVDNEGTTYTNEQTVVSMLEAETTTLVVTSLSNQSYSLAESGEISGFPTESTSDIQTQAAEGNYVTDQTELITELSSQPEDNIAGSTVKNLIDRTVSSVMTIISQAQELTTAGSAISEEQGRLVDHHYNHQVLPDASEYVTVISPSWTKPAVHDPNKEHLTGESTYGSNTQDGSHEQHAKVTGQVNVEHDTTLIKNKTPLSENQLHHKDNEAHNHKDNHKGDGGDDHYPKDGDDVGHDHTADDDDHEQATEVVIAFTMEPLVGTTEPPLVSTTEEALLAVTAAITMEEAPFIILGEAVPTTTTEEVGRSTDTTTTEENGVMVTTSTTEYHGEVTNTTMSNWAGMAFTIAPTTEEVGEAITTAATTEEVGEAVTTAATTEEVGEAVTTAATTEEVGEAVTTAATTEEVGEAVTTAATTEEVGEAVTTAATTEEVGEAVTTVATTEEVGEAVTTAATTEEVGEAVTTAATTEEVGEAVTIAATTEEVGEAVTTAATTEEVGEAVTTAATTEEVGEAVTTAAMTEEVGEAVTTAATTEAVGEAVTTVATTEEVGEAVTTAATTEEVGEAVTTAATIEEVGEAVTTAATTEEVGDDVTAAATTEEAGDVVTAAATTEEAGEVVTAAATTEEAGEVATAAATTEEPGEIVTAAATTEEAGEIVTAAATTEEAGEIVTAAATTEEAGEIVTAAATTEEAGEVVTAAATTEEAGEVVTAAATTEEAGEVVTAAATTEEAGEVVTAAATTEEAGEVVTAAATTEEAGEVVTAAATTEEAGESVTVISVPIAEEAGEVVTTLTVPTTEEARETVATAAMTQEAEESITTAAMTEEAEEAVTTAAMPEEAGEAFTAVTMAMTEESGEAAATATTTEEPGVAAATAATTEGPGVAAANAATTEGPGEAAATAATTEEPGVAPATAATTEEPEVAAATAATTEGPGEAAATAATTEEPGEAAATAATTEEPGEAAATAATTEEPGEAAATAATTEEPGETAAAGTTTKAEEATEATATVSMTEEFTEAVVTSTINTEEVAISDMSTRPGNARTMVELNSLHDVYINKALTENVVSEDHTNESNNEIDTFVTLQAASDSGWTTTDSLIPLDSSIESAFTEKPKIPVSESYTDRPHQVQNLLQHSGHRDSYDSLAYSAEHSEEVLSPAPDSALSHLSGTNGGDGGLVRNVSIYHTTGHADEKLVNKELVKEGGQRIIQVTPALTLLLHRLLAENEPTVFSASSDRLGKILRFAKSKLEEKARDFKLPVHRDFSGESDTVVGTVSVTQFGSETGTEETPADESATEMNGEYIELTAEDVLLLIPIIIEELKNGVMTAEEQELFQGVFGDLWPIIVAEAAARRHRDEMAATGAAARPRENAPAEAAEARRRRSASIRSLLFGESGTAKTSSSGAVESHRGAPLLSEEVLFYEGADNGAEAVDTRPRGRPSSQQHRRHHHRQPRVGVAAPAP